MHGCEILPYLCYALIHPSATCKPRLILSELPSKMRFDTDVSKRTVAEYKMHRKIKHADSFLS